MAFQETVDYQILTASWVSNLNSLFYVCDNEGKFHLYTTDQDQVTKMQQSCAPNWQKNPICVDYSAQNTTLTTYSQNEKYKNKKLLIIKIRNVMSDLQIDNALWEDDVKAVLGNWSRLEEELDDVHLLCKAKMQELGNESEEAQMWRLISSSLGSVDNITKALGFEKDDIIERTEKYTGKSHREQISASRIKNIGKFFFIIFLASARSVKNEVYKELDQEETQDFFNTLSVPTTDNFEKDSPKVENSDNLGKNTFYGFDTEIVVDKIQRNKNWFAGTEDLIRRNILVGCYDGAIDCCMKAGRFPEAFVVSFIKCLNKENGSIHGMKNVIDEFMNTTNDPFINSLLQSMANNNWDDVINGSDFTRWKETASAICSNVDDRNMRDEL